jgi:hypothetical protein
MSAHFPKREVGGYHERQGRLSIGDEQLSHATIKMGATKFSDGQGVHSGRSCRSTIDA